jgi:hypothetical protein
MIRDQGGDISARLELRKRLGCQPFSWYIDKFRTVFDRKGMLDDPTGHNFHIRDSVTGLCLDTSSDSVFSKKAKSLGLIYGWPCVQGKKTQHVRTLRYQSIFFQFRAIRSSVSLINTHSDLCLDANAGLGAAGSTGRIDQDVILYYCAAGNDMQKFRVSLSSVLISFILGGRRGRNFLGS